MHPGCDQEANYVNITTYRYGNAGEKYIDRATTQERRAFRAEPFSAS